jgi:cardiolipin synthase
MDGNRPAPVPRWLPNAISLLRILLVPAWIVFAEQCRAAAASGGDGAGARAAATATLLLIGASDVVDGWLARRFGLATPLGATLDAVADKLCQVALVTWLTLRAAGDGAAFAPLPAWFMALLVARDAFMLCAYLLLRRRLGAVRVVHRYHGKLVSALLFLLLVGVTAGLTGGLLQPALLLIAAAVVASTMAYARDGRAQLRAAAAD